MAGNCFARFGVSGPRGRRARVRWRGNARLGSVTVTHQNGVTVTEGHGHSSRFSIRSGAISRSYDKKRVAMRVWSGLRMARRALERPQRMGTGMADASSAVAPRC